MPDKRSAAQPGEGQKQSIREGRLLVIEDFVRFDRGNQLIGPGLLNIRVIDFFRLLRLAKGACLIILKEVGDVGLACLGVDEPARVEQGFGQLMDHHQG